MKKLVSVCNVLKTLPLNMRPQMQSKLCCKLVQDVLQRRLPCPRPESQFQLTYTENVRV